MPLPGAPPAPTGAGIVLPGELEAPLGEVDVDPKPPAPLVPPLPALPMVPVVGVPLPGRPKFDPDPVPDGAGVVPGVMPDEVPDEVPAVPLPVEVLVLVPVDVPAPVAPAGLPALCARADPFRAGKSAPANIVANKKRFMANLLSCRVLVRRYGGSNGVPELNRPAPGVSDGLAARNPPDGYAGVTP